MFFQVCKFFSVSNVSDKDNTGKQSFGDLGLRVGFRYLWVADFKNSISLCISGQLVILWYTPTSM